MIKVKLGEVADILSGYAFKSTQFNTEKRGLPLIRIRDVERGFSDTYFEGDFAEEYLVHNGDLLITMDGSFILKKWAGGEALLNQRVCKLIIRDNRVEEDYISWIVPKYLKEIEDKTPFVTVKHLSVAKINEISFELPHRSEQLVISNQLNNIKDIYNLRLQQLSKLSDLVKSRFYEMFGDPILNEKNWKKCHLKDIATEKLSYGSGASAVEFSGLRYIRITDIDDNGNLKSDAKSPSSFDEKYLLNDGDILFARSGATVGKTFCYSRQKHGRAIYAGYLIRLVPDFKQVNSTFVYHFTNTKYYDDFIFKAQKAVAQPNINAQQYGELDFILPPLTLQNQFADFVAEVDKSQLAGQMVLKLWRKLLKFSIIKLSFYEK